MRTYGSFIAYGIVTVMLCLAGRTQAAFQTFYYEDRFRLPIPAGAGDTKGWMDDAILNVPDRIIIADLDVMIDLTHTSICDLQLSLKGPLGDEVLLNAYDLADGYLPGGDYDQTILDDEADTA